MINLSQKKIQTFYENNTKKNHLVKAKQNKSLTETTCIYMYICKRPLFKNDKIKGRSKIQKI